jgi:hypothetical protein
MISFFFAFIYWLLIINFNRDATSFFQIYSECLTSSNSRVFNSAMKVFPDFNLLCSSKFNLIFFHLKNGNFK